MEVELLRRVGVQYEVTLRKGFPTNGGVKLLSIADLSNASVYGPPDLCADVKGAIEAFRRICDLATLCTTDVTFSRFGGSYGFDLLLYRCNSGSHATSLVDATPSRFPGVSSRVAHSSKKECLSV